MRGGAWPNCTAALASAMKTMVWRLKLFRCGGRLRSDSGPEFTAKAIRVWLNRIGVKTLFIQRGSPWENGYIESFNGKLRDELSTEKSLPPLRKPGYVLIEQWRKEYNQVRPYSAKNYRPPAPEAVLTARLT